MSKNYEAVIGLEIHAQLKTESKIFCLDPTNFDALDNENVSVVSAGMPGSLPVINAKAVEYAIKAGLALGCQIKHKSVFARKNYFYPDLPKGYQISQYDLPLCENGQVQFTVDGVEKTVRIERAHMEEDAGKSTHFGEYTLLNYNRAGIPLLEIVSAPEMHHPKEAAEYAKTVRQILRYLDVCDGNLEEGSLRCDCNISVRKIGEKKLGTKVEIKNVNSFRFVEKSLEYEIERQIDTIERGEKIVQETRLYDPDKNRTFTMRTKEDAQDYRYFPDPDLLPLIVSEQEIQKYKSQLPLLPYQLAQQLIEQHGLSRQDAEVLTAEKEIAEFFQTALKKCPHPKTLANWIMTELIRELNSSNSSISQSPISAERLAELVLLVEQGVISGKIAKTVFAEMWSSKKTAHEIIKEKNLVQITDHGAIEKIIDDVLASNQMQVAEYKSGKAKLFGFFVGAIMKATKGQANPDLVNKILTEKLKN